MQIKKIISAATALCLFGASIQFGGFPAADISDAAEELSFNGFTYMLNTRGNITIKGYTGSDTSVIVPDTIDGLPVTTILSEAFYNKVRGVYIPKSVVSIGENLMWNGNGDDSVIFGEAGSYAETYSQDNRFNFYSVDSLSGSFGDDIQWKFDIETFSLSVSGSGAMPVYTGYDIYTLESYKAKQNIPWYGFRHAILSADIGGTVSTVGEAAFYECDKMKTVTMGDSVTKIDNYAFSECEVMESIEFSDSLSYIAPHVFVRCYKLTEVELPSALKTITFSTFNGCDTLSAVNVDAKNEKYCSVNGVVYSKDMSVLYFYPDAKTDKSFTVPDTVTTIEDYAVENAQNLEELTLSDKLEYIGSEALALTGVKSLTIPESVKTLEYYCLYSNALSTVVFKGSAPSHSKSLFNTRGTNTTDVYCHFSDTSWYTFMDEFTENINWIDLDAFPENGIELGETSVSVKEREECTVGFKASPDIADSLIWKSSNNSVATANNGVITGISKGLCTITVSDASGRYSAVCKVTVTAGSAAASQEPVVSVSGELSSNESANSYMTYGNTVRSYLSETSDGLLERVEYTDSKVIVERYKKAGGAPAKTFEIEPAYSIFGGFCFGEKYNYIVSGQTNKTKSSGVNVLCVEKYSKDWKKLSSLEIPSSDTYIPFDAGSCRIAEKDNLLFIHAAQELVIGHQSNMTFKIDTDKMELLESMTFVSTISTLSNFEQEGFVSHSFNQFIKEEDGYVYRVDHGEGDDYGINVSKCKTDGSIKEVSTVIPYSFISGTWNETGASIGGFELSSGNIIVAASTIEQLPENYPNGQRNIMLAITSKSLKNPRTVWLTQYKKNSGVTAKTPHIVRIGSEQFLVMWEEAANGAKITKSVMVDGSGNKLTDIVSLNYPLSDCLPQMMSDGYIRWYVSNGNGVNIYAIDPYKLDSYSSGVKGDVNCDGSFSVADLVMLQKELLGSGTVFSWKNGDLCKDELLDTFDLVMMRKLLVSQKK